jgi:hypothetical protein
MKSRGLVRSVALIAALIALQTSCAVVQKIIDPVKKERTDLVIKHYDKDGLKFSYPDNWRVTEDTIVENNIRQVYAEDSDSTYLALHIMSSDYEVDMEEHANTLINDVRTKLSIGKVVEVTSGTSSRQFSGRTYDSVRRVYGVSLLGEIVSHTLDLFLVKTDKTKTLVNIQAPTKDLPAAEKEIQIIADSLRIE